jgi:predicted HicB family RNase H-like nuclease
VESRFPYREVVQQFKLRVPEDLHRSIRIDAAERLMTIRGIALNILSDHLGTKHVDPYRRPRREVA